MRMLCSEKISKNKYKTPEGYLLCQNAILSRVGKQSYMKSELYPNCDSDEIIEVDRKPEDVFSEEALASFEGKPVTLNHPSESVGPDNYNELAVGHVSNIRRGKDENGTDVMIGDILITDPQCIENIENGIMTDLSCGYDTDITDGPNPCQTNIRGNHVALCEEGRAGCARIVDSKTIKDNTVEQAQEIINKAKKFIRENAIEASILGRPATNEVRVNCINMDKFDVIIKDFEANGFEVYNIDKDFGFFFIKNGKPKVTDSVSRGTLIQEFGKQGDQYKIVKIEKNTIYAEEVNTGKTVLLKKDKEGIDWDIISKTNLNDNNSVKDTRALLEELQDLEEAWDYYDEHNNPQKCIEIEREIEKVRAMMESGKFTANSIELSRKELWKKLLRSEKTVISVLKGESSIDKLLIKPDSYKIDEENPLNSYLLYECTDSDLEVELKRMGNSDYYGITGIKMSNVKDSLSNKDEVIADIKSKLTNIDFKDINQSKNAITIDFDTIRALNKAMKVLKKEYDVEAFDDDLYIAVYDKVEKEIKDSKDMRKPIKDNKENEHNDFYIGKWHLQNYNRNGGQYWLYNPNGLGGSLTFYYDKDEILEAENMGKQVLGFEGSHIPESVYNQLIRGYAKGKFDLNPDEFVEDSCSKKIKDEREFSDYYEAEKEAKRLGLKLAEYGDITGSKKSYAYWNKSGDRNDEAEIYVEYEFGEDGKPKKVKDVEDEYVIWYLETPTEILTIEMEASEVPTNLEDYVNDIISAGYKNFKLYRSMSNAGLFDLLAKVRNGEIIEIDDKYEFSIDDSCGKKKVKDEDTSKIDRLKNKIDALEEAYNKALDEDDYDKADELQEKIDSAYNHLARLEGREKTIKLDSKKKV